MPLHAVQCDLASGALVALYLPEFDRLDYWLHALWRQDCAGGIAPLFILDFACLNG